MNKLVTTVLKGFPRHIRTFTVKAPKRGFPSVGLSTFSVKQELLRPRRVGCRPGCAAGPTRQAWGGRPRLAAAAAAAVCLFSGFRGFKDRRRLVRRQIKPTAQETARSVSHLHSGAWVSSEHSDPPCVCRQVETAPRGTHFPSSQPRAP